MLTDLGGDDAAHQTVLALLKAVGAGKASEIKPELRDEFIKIAKQKLAEAAMAAIAK